MTDEQAVQLLALAQSQYDADLDLVTVAHRSLAYSQATFMVVSFAALVVLVSALIICALLRPKPEEGR